MQDGTPLKDSKGNITSHLIGLFSRWTAHLRKRLKLVFVFDGEPPALKLEERERRKAIKAEALTKFKAAETAKDIAEMKKYAGRTATLTKEMVWEAKELLHASTARAFPESSLIEVSFPSRISVIATPIFITPSQRVP